LLYSKYYTLANDFPRNMWRVPWHRVDEEVALRQAQTHCLCTFAVRHPIIGVELSLGSSDSNR